MLITPASLLYKLQKQDEPTAWERFIAIYTPLLYHWAKQLGQQDSDSADLVQDVFLILWRKLPEFEYDPGKKFSCLAENLVYQSISIFAKKPGTPLYEPHRARSNRVFVRVFDRS